MFEIHNLQEIVVFLNRTRCSAWWTYLQTIHNWTIK